LGFSVLLPVALIFSTVMVALIFIDAEHMILPNVITYPLLVFALVIRGLYPIMFDGFAFPDMLHAPLVTMATTPSWALSLIGAVFGGLVGGGSLWLVGEIWKRLRGVDAMGLGDVKMMFGVGALLGWRLTFLTIFLAAFTGAVAGIAVIAKSKDKNMQAQIPFGIFLGIGAIIALLFGEQLVSWYASTFLP
jgi:leader peptidase (prepilin peptidase)/N-methyltransferase